MLRRNVWILGLALAALVFAAPAARADDGDGREDFHEERPTEEIEEFDFIGYYFMRHEASNIAPTNEFLKGQIVGRFFGGNTTRTTSEKTSRFTEQRFMPMITYSPRLFDGWAKIRTSLEFDWTWGDANYGAGGNFGGAFGADTVNMQTQNLFMEIRPNKTFFLNMGLLRLYDNVQVPWYTFTDHLLQKGYRLSMFGSDATGVGAHWFFRTDQRIKLGAYQLYENNVEQRDDVALFEVDYERDLAIDASVGVSAHYLMDRGNGEGGVSILGQGLSSGLSNYNGVFNFDLGGQRYKGDIFWLGTHFHRDPLLQQGRLGWSGFAWWNGGTVRTDTRDVDVNGVAANLRVAARWGALPEDQVVFDGVFTTGDEDNTADGTYSGVLTGNNWTSPGAVFIGHPLYLLLPHGDVVNRFNAAVMDIQNIGYGVQAGALSVAKELVPNKWRVKAAVGHGRSSADPDGGGSTIGTEFNASLRWTMRVFLEAELHAAYLSLGDFYDSPVVNGGVDERPDDPWTVFASLKWIMF